MALLLVVAAVGPAGAQGTGGGTTPLRKTDLIRLLTSSTMTRPQIADEVQKNCLTFTPSPRDRANLVAMGADSGIMAQIDACTRARAAAVVRRPPTPAAAPPPTPAAPATPVPAAPAPPARLVAVPIASRVQAPLRGTALVGVALKRGNAPVAGARLVLLGSARLAGGGAPDASALTDERGLAQFRFPAGATPGTYRLGVVVEGDSLSAPAEVQLTIVAPPPVAAAPPARPVAPATPRPAAERTGFVLGMAQRGRVGETAPLPVVFEVRDSTGVAMPGVKVTLTAVNGRLVGAQAATDSLGQVRAQVVFGERAAVPTEITGTVGSIVRTATLYPAAAPPSRLVVLLDGNALVGQVVLLAGRSAQLRIFSRDRFGNPVALTGLRAAVGDERVVRVTEVTSDSLGGGLTVTAGKAGSTNLVIQGSGLRADFSAVVRP